MGWYIRKAINVGPIRFNLSKSGIGTSFGVKGFRIGIRPDGSSYLHAGRHGIYYREELGGRRKNYQTRPTLQDYSTNNVTFYNNVTSREVKSNYQKELVQALTQSYQSFRFDYLAAIISILIVIIWLCYKNTLRIMYGCSPSLYNIVLIILIILGIFSTIYVAGWERHRRGISLIYNFEGDNFESYKKIIFAFNKIASCKLLKGIISATYLSDSYLSKINAGASTLTDSTPAYAGSGHMPWTNTNITTPLISACGRSYYFMPDGLFIFDSQGVACVNYLDIDIECHTTRFIEDDAPSDAQIVDYTWQYANKNGGPDGRFNNNYRLPICLYGVLSLKVRGKEILHIITSNADAPAEFKKAMNYYKLYVQNIKSKYSTIKHL